MMRKYRFEIGISNIDTLPWDDIFEVEMEISEDECRGIYDAVILQERRFEQDGCYVELQDLLDRDLRDKLFGIIEPFVVARYGNCASQENYALYEIFAPDELIEDFHQP